MHINSTDNLEHIFLGLHLSSANTPAVMSSSVGTTDPGTPSGDLDHATGRVGLRACCGDQSGHAHHEGD